MGGLNKAIIVGTLGKDPEIRYTADGRAVCNLSIATSESWKDKQGQRQDRTEWHRVVCYQKTAELCGEFLHKGSQACFEGRIQTRSYDKDGQKFYVTEVIANQVTFLGKRGEQQPSAQAAAASPVQQFAKRPAQRPMFDAGADMDDSQVTF